MNESKTAELATSGSLELKKSKVVFRGKELDPHPAWPFAYIKYLDVGQVGIYSVAHKGRQWEGVYSSEKGEVGTRWCNSPQEAANALEENLVSLAQEFRLLRF